MKATKTAIVTGAAGFIGSHLARRLIESGWGVVGVDSFDPFYDRSLKERNVEAVRAAGFELVEADIRDREAMSRLYAERRPELTIHLAALAGVRPSLEAPQRYVSVNVDGLASLLDAARTHGARRFVFASSSSVYGNSRKVPFAEGDPVDNPISPYAATKKAGELLCHAYAHLFDLTIPCLRFFTVYGPGQRPDLAIARFMRLLSSGEQITMFGDGSTSRDYTYIDDIVDGVVAACHWCETTTDRYGIFNLGGSSPVRLDELIREIGEVTGCTPNVRRAPMQPGDVDRTWADLTRSRKELGYEPKTSLREGLERQWAWMREASLVG
jgi:UDP-glucuronate 4-epimerase